MNTVEERVKPDIFNTISHHDLLGFHEHDRVNYKKVVQFLGFDQNDVSKIAGVRKASVRYEPNRIPREVKERFLEIANICQLVAEVFNGNIEKTALWFKTDNPLLGNLSPRNMIRVGKYKKLHRFIMEAREDANISETA